MYDEGWDVACPGCTSLLDGLDGVVAALNDRDITLLCMSQAPLETSPSCVANALQPALTHNTYRVYPHSRLITPRFSGLVELLPNGK